jgi:nucleotide-binding universal stress UspA family protein
VSIPVDRRRGLWVVSWSMTLFKRMLVAVDFSEFSQEAVRIGSGLARAFGGEVMVLHVCDTPKSVDHAVLTGHTRAIHSLLDLQKENAKAARRKLDEWVERYDWGKAKVSVEVKEGAPYAEITDQAKAINADLIVIGSHGRSGFVRMLIGSTTERVVRKATCPVLSVTIKSEGTT